MPQTGFFRISLGIIFILLIIFLISIDSFIFRPIIMLFDILILPLTLSVFFYYLLRPIVNWLGNRGVNRGLSVVLIYLTFAAMFALFIILVWPTLQEQIANFVQNAPTLVENLNRQIENIQKSGGILSNIVPEKSDLLSSLTNYLNQGAEWASGYLNAFLAFMSSFVVVIATVPVVLFYMLKEGGKINDILLGIVPRKYRTDARAALEEIDDALGGFIVSRVVVNLILGGMMYVGFLIIGLPYSLLLTFISIILNFIPYIGALLAAVPIVIVAFIESPIMALWALIIIIVAQQIQDNILSPFIFGKTLNVHPVTIIILLLLGGNIAGVLGMLLSLPFYIILKIVWVHVYRLFFQEKVDEIVE
jgi:predicted PurR-regulated permease PerM